MLTGSLIEAPDGTLGLDCNTVLTPTSCAAFFAKGFRFAVRYVQRGPVHPQDLSPQEAADILGAGLALLAVQHVKSDKSWDPTPMLGIDYGEVAADQLTSIGFPLKAVVVCDLEGVAIGTDPEAVVAYCNEWYNAVANAGFDPRLYVGWRCGLTGAQLYKRLHFKGYWAAYNVDNVPEKRGWQMRQFVKAQIETPPGITFGFDTNRTFTDKLGARMKLLAPEGWPSAH